ncbi:HAD family hydrolase [Niallia sp. NCCP-28]|uniref:HAD family hydrolase n=1 Tax=Niallia sp. NCCP-28 TaxID=2934712 RepID=UPI00207F8C94|nr:HAD family hydrolase [Niallia sp. NCCP-28]GKU84456.1 haloacid dehalogenase [Niallia sp. NCCP-28]
MDIKAIILDMDGTMLNEESKVSEELHRYLRRLRQDGLKVFIATGRTLLEIENVIPEGFEVDGFVTSNGMAAFIEEEQLFQHSLDPSLVEGIIEEAQKRNLYYEVHPAVGNRYALKEDKGMILHMIKGERPLSVEENEWISRKSAVEEHINWKSELHPNNISKIYFFHTDKGIIKSWISFLEKLKLQHGFSSSSSTENNVEVMSENINKATGVEYLLKRYNLSFEEVLAVGDGENDLPLLKRTGHAVAMKNAPESVKLCVDEQTEFSYKENGLYYYLSNKFKLNEQ